MFSAGEPSQPLSQQRLQSASNRLSDTSKRAARSFRRFRDARARTADSTGRQRARNFPPKSGLFHQKFGLWRLLSSLSDSICRLTSVERSTSRQESKPSRHLFTRGRIGAVPETASRGLLPVSSNWAFTEIILLIRHVENV